MSRIPDVGNPWLDAGIVTFSTLGYRNNREYWEQWYPADWISESFPGQFRNWFYSLLAMSTALKNHEPTRAVFSYALMRDEKGEEMHKSKGNAIWFEDAAGKMGVDVMRWLYCRQNPSSNLNFGYGPGDEVRRQFLIPLWNVYSFFVTYANLDGWTPSRADDPGERSELDRWLLSELDRLTARVTTYLENWRPHYAAQAIEEFTDGLSNWYVRRSRRRYWKSEDDGDKQAAYSTLYNCLATLSRVLAPFTPVRGGRDVQQPRGRVGRQCARERSPDRLAHAGRKPDRRATVGADEACDAPFEPRTVGPVIGRSEGTAAVVGTGGRASPRPRTRLLAADRGATARGTQRQTGGRRRGDWEVSKRTRSGPTCRSLDRSTAAK